MSTPPAAMSADELRGLFVLLLVGVMGGKPERWHRVVGEVQKQPLSFSAEYNWTVSPAGSAADLDAVEKAAAVIRAEHPYID